jgi:hypothetical protein
MIIQLESATAADAEAARRSLQDLARGWGQDLTPAPASTAPAARTLPGDGKAIDPVSLATLVVSLPSAALAALDLADRIRKRRRAGELIDHARHQATQQVSICLITQGRPVELRSLTPDQLLDQIAGEDPADRDSSTDPLSHRIASPQLRTR